MAQIVTLTPSEFMLAVHNQSISPAQLSKRAGLPTLKMRSFYQVSDGVENKANFEVVIGGVRQPKLTIMPEARMWHELLNISIAGLNRGKTFEQTLKLMLDAHYGRFIDIDDESTVGIKSLFDQVYYFLLYFECSERNVSSH